jgi:hypothetical protein
VVAGRGKELTMRWLRNTVVTAGVVGGLAMMAGGCEYDDHDYHHDHYYRERPVVYRERPVVYRVEPERRWDRDHDWDRHYDRYWDDRDGRWHDRRW